MPRPRIVTRIGITRRLQALRALGWSTTQIAALCHLYPATVRRAVNDTSGPLTEATMRAVVHGYRLAEAALPPTRTDRDRRQVRQIRDSARDRGWAPPHAWDDIDHDKAPKGIRKTDTFVVGVDEAILLLQLGVYPGDVAKRLGIKRESLARRLRRAKQHKWAALVERKDA